MVELQTRFHKSGHIYIPKELREAFGREMKIVPNAAAALFFPAATSYEDVLKSLEIIKMDLEHRLNMKKNQEKAEQLEKENLSEA